jgi:hypothetical protein
MPWAPELFSAPTLQRLEEKLGHELAEVPFFDGLMTGELDAVVGSFADEPELHHPVRGRIRGARAFATYVSETNAWLSRAMPRLSTSHTSSLGRVALGRWSFTSGERADESGFRWRSSPTGSSTEASTNCGCTTAAGR